MRTRLATLALVAGVSLTTAACAPGTPASTAPTRSPLVSSEPVASVEGLPPGTAVQRIVYRSTGVGGEEVEVSGLLLLPAGAGPARPLLAWAHGTTGVDDRCAPSADPALAGYVPVLSGYLRAGHPVVATDYEGLGAPGDHPYLVAESQARSIIDSVAAARALEPSLGEGWVSIGHSQGGQAALAAAELSAAGTTTGKLLGAVSYAPAPNMSGEVDELGQAVPAEQALYTMMLVGLQTQHRELDYTDYLSSRATALVEAARTQCIDDLLRTFEKAGLPGADFTPRSSEAAERLRGWFARNELGHGRTAVPVLVAQGEADVVVRPETTREIVDAMRSQGGAVTDRLYPGADHGSVLTASAQDVTRFLDGLS